MSLSVSGIVLLFLVFSGCAFEQTVMPVPPVTSVIPPATGQAAAIPGGRGYLINVGDELEVKFPDHSDLNELVRVRPDGQISLRLINAVQADGRTPAELEADIAKQFRALTVPTATPITGSIKTRRYLIGVADELEVKFPYHQGFDQTVRVRPDGRISLNHVRTVDVEGKTPEELESELNVRYSAILKRPNLVVIVKSSSPDRVFVGDVSVRPGLENVRPVVMVRSFTPPQVFVGGEVVRPGVHAYRGRMTLLSAILEAGGGKATAEIGTVLVLRRTGVNNALAIRRDLRPNFWGTGNNDIFLEPSDIIIVPKTPIAEVAQVMQQLFSVLPPLANSSLGFAYQLNEIQILGQ